MSGYSHAGMVSSELSRISQYVSEQEDRTRTLERDYKALQKKHKHFHALVWGFSPLCIAAFGAVLWIIVGVECQ